MRFRPAQIFGDIQTFTIFEKLHVFIILKNQNIENRIIHQSSPRLPRDSPLYDPWWRGKTWNKDFNGNYEISNTNFFVVFDELRHYTIFEKRVSLETQCFQKNKKLKHRKSDSPSKFI